MSALAVEGLSLSGPALVCLVLGIACALVAGVFQAFSDFVMRGLLLAAPAGGIESMQAINRTVLRSAFLTTAIALVPLLAMLAAYAALNLSGAGRLLVLAAALIYVGSVFIVTALGNVPMNEHLASLGHRSDEARAYWAVYGQRWTGLNHVRTVGAAISALCLLLAAQVL